MPGSQLPESLAGNWVKCEESSLRTKMKLRTNSSLDVKFTSEILQYIPNTSIHNNAYLLKIFTEMFWAKYRTHVMNTFHLVRLTISFFHNDVTTVTRNSNL